MNETAQRWVARVAEWRASGLSQSAFCRGRDYSSNSLSTWSLRLKKMVAERPVSLARVVTPTRPAVDRPSGTGLVIQVDRIQVVVEPATDRTLLREVLAALRAVG